LPPEHLEWGRWFDFVIAALDLDNAVGSHEVRVDGAASITILG
jgi:hypothetical protein